jgi:hypothetical protein
LDYRNAPVHDVRFLLKEEWVLSAIEDERASQLNALAHQWHCSAAQLTAWDEQGKQFEFHRKEASKTFKAIGKLTLPWYKQWTKPDERSLAELWKRFKEAEKNPEYAKWLREERKRINDYRAQAMGGGDIDTAVKELNQLKKGGFKKKRR